jgi:hypothetical protein
MNVNAGTVYINSSAIQGLGEGTPTGQGNGIISSVINSIGKKGPDIGGIITNIIQSIMSIFTKNKPQGGSSGGSNIGGFIQAIASAFNPAAATTTAAASSFTSSSMFANAMSAPVFHSGGMVSNPTNFRVVDPSMFNNAPKFHTGRMPKLAAHEMPAILTKDEMVLTKGQQKAIGSGRGSTMVNFSPNININYSSANGEGSSATSRQDAEDMGRIMNQQLKAQFKDMLVKEMGQGGLLRNAR